MNLNSNKLTNILLITILVLFIGYMLRENIYWFFKRGEIKGHTSILRISDVREACKEWLEDPREDIRRPQKCVDVWNEHKPFTEAFTKMINSSNDIDCSDFPSWYAAQMFYEYLGNDYYEESDSKGGKYYDPYNLDTNRDGMACENLN